MFLLGQTRYLDLRVLNGTTPVTGLLLTGFTVLFLRNNATCADALTLHENGNGRYTVSYTPSAAGHDFIDFTIIADSYYEAFSEDIVSASMLLGGTTVENLTQNTPTTNALKVTVPSPQNYTLYVYNSSDWVTGSTQTFDALASTQLDSSGNWITTPLNVVPGTYHIVIRDGSGYVQVIKAFLTL